MAPIPAQKVDISQTSSQPPQNQESGSGSAGSVPSPQDRAPLGANYYLTEGLEGVEAQHYHGTQSFMTAIKSQADQLRSGDAGQYAVFSQVTQHQFADLERFRDTNCKSLRFLYYEKEETLIVKIMAGPAHEVTCARFQFLLNTKVAAMGLGNELCDMRTTKYQGKGSGKQPDCAFQPRSPRPDITDWPTLVVECGVSQSLKSLRGDSHWWFTNSEGKVKTILLFSVLEKKRKIYIEQWEMRKEAKCIRTIDIVEADAAGGSLRLSFEHLFLRKPMKGETDIVFSTEDLEELGAYVWCCPGCRPLGRAPTGLPSQASGLSRASGVSGASLSS